MDEPSPDGSRRSIGHVRLDHVAITLGLGSKAFQAVTDLSFEAAPGELLCLLGPSGCGKSTVLSALAGHLEIAAGTIAVDGKPVAGPSADRGLVFQQHTLFPWKTVRHNVAFGPKMAGVGRRRRLAVADEFLAMVGLVGFEEFYPAQLSGGMQQRVEIARALINHPRVLLMDEPFSALDAMTRGKMQQVLLDLWARMPTTIVFVTHDIDEALFLADRIIVMSDRPGRIVEDMRLSFERPRTPDLVTEMEFVRLKRHVMGLLRQHG